MHSNVLLIVTFWLTSSTIDSLKCTPLTDNQRIRYEPNWESLDTRPIPKWYDEAKIGIFIHWGVFSVPAFHSEWFWWNWKGLNDSEIIEFMEKNYKPGFSYPEFGPLLTAEFYDPNRWADLFKKSGAKYVVLTSKHHEGYTLWPSSTSWNWNSVDVGPKQDLLGRLANSTRAAGLTFGVYHSLYEWFNPLYLSDKNNGFKTQEFVAKKTMPELYDLVNTYKPDVIWSDGDWETSAEYWNSTNFLSWLYNDSPVRDTVVTNDRWGAGVGCKHGDFLTCSDRYNPGELQVKKWENAMTLDKGTWGFSRTSSLKNYLRIEDLLLTLAQTISYGGNLLVNVGPTADGRIEPIFEERLLQMGQWLEVNGDAVYQTKPWKTAQNDSLTRDVYYTQSTSSHETVFAIFFNWPQNNILELGSLHTDSSTRIALIRKNMKVKVNFVQKQEPVPKTVVNVGEYPRDVKWGWTLEIQNPA